ncbi:MAG: hypothetical protein ACW964_20470, partial [Candidatus Hodarchaeales archaeon]
MFIMYAVPFLFFNIIKIKNMKIYLARPNKLSDLHFNRAKRIIAHDCKLLDIYHELIYHDKLGQYDPNLIKTSDLVIFVTYMDGDDIGRGLVDQINTCSKNSIPHYLLTINKIGSSLSNRRYHDLLVYHIKDADKYDERHAEITDAIEISAPKVYKTIKTKKNPRPVNKIISSLDQLILYGPLIYNDTVEFTHQGYLYRYNVRPSFLSSMRRESHRNDAILKCLFKTDDHIKDFLLSKYYYLPGNGEWPNCKIRDYSALTRAVKGIYEILEQRPDSDEVFASEEDEIDPEDL